MEEYLNIRVARLSNVNFQIGSILQNEMFCKTHLNLPSTVLNGAQKREIVIHSTNHT